MQNKLFSVKEKVIILTGGSGILGSCMAKHLAKEGAAVVVLDRNEVAGKALEEDIRKDGGEVLFLYTDVLDKQTLEGNAQAIIETYGDINDTALFPFDHILCEHHGRDDGTEKIQVDHFAERFDVEVKKRFIGRDSSARHVTAG